MRGPLTGTGPAPGTWSVVRPKEAGFAPGFTMRDAKGDLWFVSFDAKGFPEAATGAILVANKIFWTLGYWQVENYPRHRCGWISSPSRTRRRSRHRPARSARCGVSDIEDVLRRSHRSPDGAYRAIAARAVPGKPLGGFRYYGTRPDDPNDIVPHEHRRELRALKVFGAWTNLTDMKAGNTLDTLVTADGRGTVRHYLQDVGSTFGTGANAPHDYDEGWEAALRRRSHVKAALHLRLLPSAVADRGVREAARDRPLRGHGVRSGRLDASRADRRLPAAREPTTRSGRRGG